MSLTKASFSMISGAPANVLDFGADPTGVEDSSAAVTAALAASNSVYFPEGTYKASFDLDDAQTIFGVRGKSIIKPPSGALWTIRIDASSQAKSAVTIRDLNIQNIDLVPNCNGIYFKGTNVFSINDFHTVENVYIENCNHGIEIQGRMIWCAFYQVIIRYGDIGINVGTDNTTPAFNLNTFIECRIADTTGQGIKIEGQNVNIQFYGLNVEGCNSSNTVGLAAIDVQNSEMMLFSGCYIENNGYTVPVDPNVVTNNSIAFKFSGYCASLCIDSNWVVGSGALCYFPASVRGGTISNSRFSSLPNGIVISLTASLFTPLNFDFSNYVTVGSIQINEDANGQYPATITQPQACTYVTGAFTPNLLFGQTYVCNATFTISNIVNNVAGAKITIIIYGTNTVTFGAGLVASGSTTVSTGERRTYVVSGYPWGGQLVEI